MKRCPKCHAELQENARFCLYCMTSFEEKQPAKIPPRTARLLYAVIAVLLVAVIVVFCVTRAATRATPHTVPPTTTDTFVTSHTDLCTPSDDVVATQSSVETADTTAKSDGTATSTTEIDTTATSHHTNTVTLASTADGTVSSKQNRTTTAYVSNENRATTSSQSRTTTSSQSRATTTRRDTTSAMQTTTLKTTADTSAAVTTSATAAPTTTTAPVTTSTPAVQAPCYRYVAATSENAYPPHSQPVHPPEDAVVITKVEHIANDGVYAIPDTIDGKRVLAIAPYAFSNEDVRRAVKSVILPASVKTVWENAFDGCVDLRHLYLKAAQITIYCEALPAVSDRNATLTIYAARECMDHDYYYYRNIAETQYGAAYKEWNG